MDTLSPHHKNAKVSNSSSSGCSAASSTTDIKSTLKNQRSGDSAKPSGLRSKSFLLCLGKHLGRHFSHSQHNHPHHHHHHTLSHNGHTIVYNSQEDLRSSSTDSFSLSYERNSRLDSLNNGNAGTSSLDLSSEEMNSRTSSASGCSRLSADQELDMENCTVNQPHIYIATTIYRASSSLDCHDDIADYSEADSGNSSSDENNEEEEVEEHEDRPQTENNKNCLNVNGKITQKSKSSPASVSNTPSCSLTTSSSKGLHLSRLSITSSVKSMLQHFSTVSGVTTRSLSCSSTPLRRVWDTKCRKSQTSGCSTNASSKSSSSTSSSSASSNSNSRNQSSNKKPEKKQQSILRPPIHYVYMKGMSGLYSRVPSYTVCCPYGTQQWA
ncbi:serum factor response D [Musca domestica]|uniref:Serum factor response D n=1 Tax=Musca domestica TaxID=7370 RepID=A0A9J7CZT4_MUSDO|nr:serum factor response D [Musca domestica]